jgi:hypothetical protein
MPSLQTRRLGRATSVTFSLKARFGFTIETSESVFPSAMSPSMLTTARFQSR